MRTIETNCSPGSVKKTNLGLPSLLTLICCMMALFLSFNVSAQTFPTSCTSKDLTLLKASLPAPAGNRCACSGDRSLILGIHNGTSSVRTSFALWGTLHRYDASGTEILPTKSIFACAGPIGKNGDYFMNATTIKIDGVNAPTASVVTTSGTLTLPVIHIDCGQSLDITDMHLAWTSANSNETCDVLYNNPSTINPKCGVQDIIHVDLGLNGTFNRTQSTCTTKGQIVVTPQGGLAPYQVCLYKKTSANATDSTQVGCQTVNGTSTTTATFSTLDDAYYTMNITDNMNASDVTQRCSINLFTSIANPDNVSTPNATVQNPGCDATTGTCNVTSPVSGVTYKLLQSGSEMYSTTNGVFTGVAPGTYDLKAIKGICNATNTGAVVIANPPSNPTFTVSITQPTLCDKGSLTITPSGGSGFTYRINGTGFNDATLKNNTGVFNNLVTGDVTAVQVKNSDGCLSAVKTCAQVSAPITNKAKPEPILQVNTNDNPSVLAYPNPFNDHVKFVVSAPKEGKGSLEIYNILGQKVKTVYQGHINAGSNAFELSLPKKDQSTLIYIFRVGDKKVTGKLLQLNN